MIAVPPNSRAGEARPNIGNFQAAKESWLKIVASHPNLSGADYAIAIMICTYVNSRTREAWPSLETLAQDTNRAPSTAWRSVERLEKLELLEITRARGRTRSHRYRLKFGNMDRDPKTLRRRNTNTAGSQSKHYQSAGRTSEGSVEEP